MFLRISLSCAVTAMTLTLFSGCTQFPELDEAVLPENEVAEYPPLVPIETLLAEDVPDPQRGEAEADALTARADSLRARAARLQGNVLDNSTRQRLEDGVETE